MSNYKHLLIRIKTMSAFLAILENKYLKILSHTLLKVKLYEFRLFLKPYIDRKLWSLYLNKPIIFYLVLGDQWRDFCWPYILLDKRKWVLVICLYNYLLYFQQFLLAKPGALLLEFYSILSTIFLIQILH